MKKDIIRILNKRAEHFKKIDYILDLRAIEKAIETIEKLPPELFSIHDVVVPKGTLCDYCKKPIENTCCNDCLEEMDSHSH